MEKYPNWILKQLDGLFDHYFGGKKVYTNNDGVVVDNWCPECECYCCLYSNGKCQRPSYLKCTNDRKN